jgi:hypothetical protein
MVLELKVTRGIKLFFGMTIFFNRDQSTRSAKSTIKLESLNNQWILFSNFLERKLES